MTRPPGTRVLDALASVVAALPFRSLAVLGSLLGGVCGSILRIRRRHVEGALARAGLPKSAAPAMYRSLGAGVFELLWLAGRSPACVDDLVLLDDEARCVIERAKTDGRGIVVAASHTGNWDLAACAVARQLPLLVITKRLSARFLDVFWQSARARFGVRLAAAEDALARGRAHLAAGGAVAMMIDQVPLRRRHGVIDDFLGAQAFIDKAPATLAARTQSLFVASAGFRTERGTHELAALLVLDPPRGAGAEWIEEATVLASRALDGFVRRHPESWLWLHRRWKKPAESPRGQAQPVTSARPATMDTAPSSG